MRHHFIRNLMHIISVVVKYSLRLNFRITIKKKPFFYPFFEEKVGIVLLSGHGRDRGRKLGSRVNFLDVLKYPEYENRIFEFHIYICTDFVIRTSLSVFDRLS